MNDQPTASDRPDDVLPGHRDPAPSGAATHGSAKAGPPPVTGHRPRSDAGAVLRRSPDPDRPGSWRVAAPSRSPSSIVDNKDTGAATRSPPRQPAQRPGLHPSRIVDAAERSGGPSSSIVDNRDGDGGYPSRIVDAAEGFERAPSPASAPPVPTRLRGPDLRKASGPSGPDDELIRRLREARKRRVADRAKARGRDPGAGSRDVGGGVTRSERTHEQYLERGRMLVKRYRREAGLENAPLDALDPKEFVNWFFSLKPTLKPTAWRPYRQAAKAILSTIPHDDVEAAIAMIDADVAEQSESRERRQPEAPAEGGDRAKLPRRTSSLKEKRVLKDDYDRMVSFLRHFSRSRFAPILVDWMEAGIATGLRPIEWQATDVEVRVDASAPGGRWVWLYVLNAKATNGRANGIVRTLDLSHFRDDTLRAVQRMSKAGSDWLLAGTYDSMQSQCAQLLYGVSDKVTKGRRIYSLYSMRHQFVANAKSYHKPEAVSALVGHVVTDTAVSSYGKKRSCWEPEDIRDRAEPVADEVATVRQRLIFFEERTRLQVEAGLLKAPNVAAGDEA